MHYKITQEASAKEFQKSSYKDPLSVQVRLSNREVHIYHKEKQKQAKYCKLLEEEFLSILLPFEINDCLNSGVLKDFRLFTFLKDFHYSGFIF
jgi:hypothetical protein